MRWSAPELVVVDDDDSDSEEEQQDKKLVKANEKTDVYSCGLVMYELANFKLPYQGKSPQKLYGYKLKESMGKTVHKVGRGCT